MTHAPSPATRLHDVVVINEQTGVRWQAGTARIDAGRIVIESPPRPRPPADLLLNPSNTFTIAALDGGERARRFQNVKFCPASSIPRQRYEFG